MSCDGETPADIENIGTVNYYPRQGFPGYYFPFKRQEGYLSPLVAVHFKRPERKCRTFQLLHFNIFYVFLTGGVLINVECKAWARNIKHNTANKFGSVHFELMID